jgi:ATP-dependent DNA helicase RecQ
VPPYVIFHDSTLREIAAARPQTMTELGHVQGVGAAKLERYGEAMLAVVRNDVAPAKAGASSDLR